MNEKWSPYLLPGKMCDFDGVGITKNNSDPK